MSAYWVFLGSHSPLTPNLSLLDILDIDCDTLAKLSHPFKRRPRGLTRLSGAIPGFVDRYSKSFEMKFHFHLVGRLHRQKFLTKFEIYH